jgi:NhaA family Na+:H+ antiporter
MVVPASIYALFNLGGAGAHGWGIPMATDIAFALGVLTLLGSRVPVSLKVFLTALAIVDDIGAVLVIALFYTPEISPAWLWGASGVLGLLAAFNRAHVRHPQAYALVTVVLWFFCLKSGIHATVAGVLAALAVPARTRCPQDRFVRVGRELIEEYRKAAAEGESVLTNPRQLHAIEELEGAGRRASTPLQRIEHQLHPWVAFCIMPLFALANAGVTFTDETLGHLVGPVSLGVFFGLVAGKQVGVTLGSWLVIRLGLADLPRGLSLRHLYAVSWLASVGFTMSMFIANLAYVEPLLIEQAKLAVLAASAFAALAGYGVLRRVLE